MKSVFSPDPLWFTGLKELNNYDLWILTGICLQQATKEQNSRFRTVRYPRFFFFFKSADRKNTKTFTAERVGHSPYFPHCKLGDRNGPKDSDSIRTEFEMVDVNGACSLMTCCKLSAAIKRRKHGA